jgi:hypothetical protein
MFYLGWSRVLSLIATEYSFTETFQQNIEKASLRQIVY